MLLKYLTSLFHSNKFANEKLKLEELIKKSEDDYEDCTERAVKAEVRTKKSNIFAGGWVMCADSRWKMWLGKTY